MKASSLGFPGRLEAGQLIRQSRASADHPGVTIKEDGCPVTQIEGRIESRLREWVPLFDPSAVVVGEETGGALPAKGTAIAIDPIDGTPAHFWPRPRPRPTARRWP